MGDMRERLAKELCRRFSAYSDGRDWEEFLEDVPPLLAILREPTEEMVAAGAERHWGTDVGDAAGDDGRDNVPQIWQAMIDTIARTLE